MTRALIAASVLAGLVSGVAPMSGRSALAGDPTTLDCLTANESSLTLRNHLDLRATRAQLLVCSAASCPADIRNECIRRMAEVNVAMPTIVFDAKDAAGHNLINVTVKMDGELLAQRLEGTALSIDPGQHTFTFEVPGHPAIAQQFFILEGEKDRRERVTFDTIGKVQPSSAPRGDSVGRVATADGVRSRLRRTSIASLVLGGVGVAGIGVGTAYALIAISRRDDAAAACPTHECGTSDGVARWNRARSAGDVATVASLVGIAGLAGGVTLWLSTNPHAEQASGAQVSLAPGFIQVLGRW
jgi:hypothetical protein